MFYHGKKKCHVDVVNMWLLFSLQENLNIKNWLSSCWNVHVRNMLKSLWILLITITYINPLRIAWFSTTQPRDLNFCFILNITQLDTAQSARWPSVLLLLLRPEIQIRTWADFTCQVNLRPLIFSELSLHVKSSYYL